MSNAINHNVSKRLHASKQMSESLITAAFLTLSGGFQDAYTYWCRGKVFANAQTGNIVLMNTYLFDGQFYHALRYLVPLLAFASGIFIAELIHRHFKMIQAVHWRQLIVLGEIFLLFIVGFIPSSLDMLANALVSFVCAMQVQTFRKVHGHAYASTMCIGNLRSGMDALCTYMHTKEKSTLHKSLHYIAIILIFAVGSGIGSIFAKSIGQRAIWISCLLLAVSFGIMFIKAEEGDDKYMP